MSLCQSITETIGRTPLLELKGLEKELGLIKARMAQLGIENMSAYLRQVAIDGYEEILLNQRIINR